ncbi:HAD family phosphatase [Verrucomicrobium sp. BvORR106]|uniref:HAD family hydrolase n=1 Tax=Verrucomicrobium sp. BvORR106 TaxID=1403819 RepID=UPI000691338C|nr:HAD family phosphatase [Verrucomicrobium sp. BvORR106]
MNATLELEPEVKCGGKSKVRLQPGSCLLDGMKAILFDMDGVLIDSEPVHAACISALAEEMGGRALEEREVLSFKGVPERQVAAGLMRLFPDAGREAPAVMKRAFDLYVERFSLVKLIPGAREFVLVASESGLRLAVATSAAPSMQQMAFDAFGLNGLFETVVTGDDVKRGKPDPEPYLLAAERLGVIPAECLVIEDSINGVKSGKAAGCRVVGLTTSFPKETLLAAGADVVVDAYGV